MGGEGGDAGTRAGGGSNGARDRAAKLFVLDTNVILHDARCIHEDADADVAAPALADAAWEVSLRVQHVLTNQRR